MKMYQMYEQYGMHSLTTVFMSDLCQRSIIRDDWDNFHVLINKFDHVLFLTLQYCSQVYFNTQLLIDLITFN